jgi:hypothetical protein
MIVISASSVAHYFHTTHGERDTPRPVGGDYNRHLGLQLTARQKADLSEYLKSFAAYIATSED